MAVALAGIGKELVGIGKEREDVIRFTRRSHWRALPLLSPPLRLRLFRPSPRRHRARRPADRRALDAVGDLRGGKHQLAVRPQRRGEVDLVDRNAKAVS